MTHYPSIAMLNHPDVAMLDDDVDTPPADCPACRGAGGLAGLGDCPLCDGLGLTLD